MQRIVVFAEKPLRTDTVLETARYFAQLLFRVDAFEIECYPEDVNPDRVPELVRELTWEKGYAAHYFFLCFHQQMESLLPRIGSAAEYAYIQLVSFDYPFFLPHDIPRDKAEWLNRDWRNALDMDGNWIALYAHERL